MRTKNIFQKQMTRSFLNLWISGLLLSVLLVSCGKDEEYIVELAGDLKLAASAENIVLQQKFDAQNGLTVQWTTGTNNGSGAAISYLLQMDKAGNNFASAQSFNIGKAVYEKSFSVAELNQRMTEDFGVTPGDTAVLEIKVTATVLTTPETTQVTDVKSVTVVTYEPVSTTLFIIGSASPNGWSADDAIALEPHATIPGVFEFKGALGAGEFKFITTRGQFLPSYNKGANSTSLVYRTDDAQPDDKFEIAEGAVYKIVADLLNLTISVTKYDLPVYDALYIVGSASPNGWDITNSIQLEQDEGNPFLFRYIGVLHAGEFKFPVNRNGDWGQDMFMRETDSTMYLHHGGDPDDNKWTIEKKGFYVLTLNLSDLSIDIHREELYIVGSATPIEWDITNSIQLVEDNEDGCIFTYEGPMVAGEFKFPVNRRSDWGQDMYMRVSDTEMYRHKGGDPDDNKWNITNAGNYRIVANLETLAISIQQR
jgi:starch-binding outer membrane protein SusE/F